MRSFKSGLAGLTVLSLVGSASATVVNFDDLVGSGPVPPGYGGVADWSSGGWNYYDNPQDPYNPHSGAERIYSTISSNDFTFDHPVTLDGAWFSGNGTPNGFPPISWNLYYQGNLVHTSGTLDCSGTPMFLSTGYNGPVDRAAINGTTDFFVLDDLTYNTVPTPGAVALLGAGTLLAARRRR